MTSLLDDLMQDVVFQLALIPLAMYIYAIVYEWFIIKFIRPRNKIKMEKYLKERDQKRTVNDLL